MNQLLAFQHPSVLFVTDFLKRRWIHILVLMIPAYFFRNAINPDGIAYIQVAKHWISGNSNLAITGYWGPLFSWALAPLLILGIPDLLACRILMILSALFFLESARGLLKQTTIGRANSKVIDYSLTFACILWSVENITPDLMLATLFIQILNFLCNSRWTFVPGSALTLGICLALAYLCKSVALPVSIALILVTLVLRKWIYPKRILLRRGCLIALIFPWILIAGSWITVLSIHYGGWTFSTSARIVHATVGPGDIQRYPIGFQIERPVEGRITNWEDPKLNASQYWSPFESFSNFRHQCSLVLNNLTPALIIHTSLFLFSIPVLLHVISRIFASKTQSWPSPRTWRGAVLASFILILTGIYMMTLLPASEQRYFYALAPILAILSFEFMRFRWFESRTILLATTICAAIVLPSIGRWILLPSLKISAFEQAQIAADYIKSNPELEPGPVVGNARMRRGRSGLFLAYFLDQQWYGGNPKASIRDLVESNAQYIVISYDDHRLPGALQNTQLSDVSTPAAPWMKIFKVKSKT